MRSQIKIFFGQNEELRINDAKRVGFPTSHNKYTTYIHTLPVNLTSKRKNAALKANVENRLQTNSMLISLAHRVSADLWYRYW